MVKMPYCDNGDSVTTDTGKSLWVKSVGRTSLTAMVSSELDAIEMGVDPESMRTSYPSQGGELKEWSSIPCEMGGDPFQLTLQYLHRPTFAAEKSGATVARERLEFEKR